MINLRRKILLKTLVMSLCVWSLEAFSKNKEFRLTAINENKIRQSLVGVGPTCVLKSVSPSKTGFRVDKNTVGISTPDRLIIGINNKIMTFIPESDQAGFFYFNQPIRYNSFKSDLVIEEMVDTLNKKNPIEFNIFKDGSLFSSLVGVYVECDSP